VYARVSHAEEFTIDDAYQSILGNANRNKDKSEKKIKTHEEENNEQHRYISQQQAGEFMTRTTMTAAINAYVYSRAPPTECGHLNISKTH
jgi:hypothetical protein